MKKVLFTIYIFAYYITYAQNNNDIKSRWSVKFTLENVFATCRDRSYGTNYKQINSSEFYEFKKDRFIPPSNFTPLTIGVLFNYKINSGLRCMFGFSQDGAYYGYSLSLRRMDIFSNADTLYNEQHISTGGGASNIKFPLLFYKSIFKTDSLNKSKKHIYDINVDLLGGINIIYQAGNSKNPTVIISDGMDSIQIDSHKYLSYASKLYAVGGGGAAWNFGFNFDVNRKQRNLFSLCIYYKNGISWGTIGSISNNILKSLNIKPVTNWTYTQTIVTVDGKKYAHELYSRGSGIYIQLSKNFSFNKRKSK